MPNVYVVEDFMHDFLAVLRLTQLSSLRLDTLAKLVGFVFLLQTVLLVLAVASFRKLAR